MTYSEILSAAQSLSEAERRSLVQALSSEYQCKARVPESSCLSSLLEKQGHCPHCGGSRYYRFGKDHGTQRFKCKDCGGTFTEYTGTWQQKLHKKGLVKAYIRLMSEQKSLDKISAALHINKKTAFDWRHKILRSLKQDDGCSFSGITESDETFFDKSDKGCRHLKRKSRKRGGECRIKGLSKDKATVIVTVDRKNDLNMTFCGYGRLTKAEIAKSLHTPLPKGTVLCSDGYTSYKGYAMDNHIGHVVIRADLGRHVKRGVYRIQHVNSLHNRLKRWLNDTFWGVATKYMQDYLNWFKVKETVLKFCNDQADELLGLSMNKYNVKFATV
ncbi:IS1595 family transposase [Bacteroides zoogleoformans]|uniref:IS1595 family transposase n=1 Tax=Bacteroides zoogleoformans TaxID=28119 RepID=UPI00248D6D8C|nr:IS1595 family transposase [Bacteroides zoogleoformans]